MTKAPIPATGPPAVPVIRPEPDAMTAGGKGSPTETRTLRCRTVAQGRFHQLNYIRDLPPQPVMEDEPKGLLVEDIAPNASEALLAAFGSCLAIGIHANAVAQYIPIRRLELQLEADIYTTVVWGASDLPPKPIGFDAIRVSVQLEAAAPREILAALIKRAVLWSPVANTLYNPIHLDVTLAEQPTL
jgi:OsmC-like protein